MVLSPQRHAQRPSSSSLFDLGLSLLKWIRSKVSTTFGNLFTRYAPQEIALPSAEGRSSQLEPPPTTIDKGKGRDPRPSALVLGDSNVNPGTTWNLNDIRSNFAHDLTGYVVQYGEHPFAYGSFGDVYRGTLRMSGRSIYVAVKAIRTYLNDDGDDAKKKKRFRREVRTWLNLDHINILPLFGTTMDFGQFPAMVSPWLENGALTSYLERLDDSLKIAERLALVGDVAAGLKYLHSQSIVHGDLSGGNVLIHADGRACISDFGLSMLLTEVGGSTFATSRQAEGTVRWTAPELLGPRVPHGELNPPLIVPTPHSDVYSFGRIMLQVLTGKVPYHYYPRNIQVVYAISQDETPQRPSQTQVTDRQWAFMQRCWIPVNAGELRPGGEEIVDFARRELLEIKMA